jgi:predicted transcriptional regulator
VDISRNRKKEQRFITGVMSMGTTTMGVKLDDATRERIKSAASRIDRTPHWLIKQAIFNYLEKLENDETLPELPALLAGAANESDDASSPAMNRISRSSNSPSRSCRSPSAAPRSPPPTAGPKPTPCRCCWSRPACRSRWRTGAQAGVSAGGKTA